MQEKAWGTPHTANNPILFLHGLPGIKSKQNQDLAEFVHQKTARPTLIQFGEGLSIRPGEFTFTKEIRNKLELLNQLPGKEITLVGHSWGGCQTLILSQSPYAHKIKDIILMSPLMGIMPRHEIDTILTTLHTDHPEVNFAERTQLLNDAATYDQAFMEQAIPKIPAHIHITLLQAVPDPITPPERAKGLLPLFKSRPNYIELNSDHQFMTNRPLLFEAVLKALT